MSIQIGELNIAQAVIDTELRVTTLEFLLEDILRANPSIIVNSATVSSARQRALKKLQDKYPSMGITLNE